MDYSNISALNLWCVLCFKKSCSFVDIIYCELAVCSECTSCFLTARINNISTTSKNLSCDCIHCHTSLRTKELGCFNKGIINCCKLQNVGKCYIVTVLCNCCFKFGYRKCATVRGNAFYKCFCCLVKRYKLSKLDCFTAIFGNGVFLPELVVY